MPSRWYLGKDSVVGQLAFHLALPGRREAEESAQGSGKSKNERKEKKSNHETTFKATPLIGGPPAKNSTGVAYMAAKSRPF